MKLLEEIKVATQTFTKMKVEMCKHFNGPHDLAPMLHFKYPHLKGYCGVLLAGGSPVQTVPAAWEIIIRDGVPEFVIVMTEGYARVGASLKNYRKGEMEENFKNDPLTDVMEIINIHGIDMKTGEQADGIVVFRYNDHGQPEFDAPSYNACEGEALKANIPMIFSACRHATLLVHKKAI